jgi:nitronate monooxygenase
MIENSVLLRMEHLGLLRRVALTTQSAIRWKQISGATVGESIAGLLAVLRSGREHGEALTQSLMAVNASMLIQSATVEGQPEHGVLPSGQVAAVIDALKSCSEVIEEIVTQATQCLTQFFENQQSDLPKGSA